MNDLGNNNVTIETLNSYIQRANNLNHNKTIVQNSIQEFKDAQNQPPLAPANTIPTVHSTIKTNKYVGIAGPKLVDETKRETPKVSESNESSIISILYDYVFGTGVHASSLRNSRRSSSTKLVEWNDRSRSSNIDIRNTSSIYSRNVTRRTNNAKSNQSFSNRSSSIDFDGNGSYSRLPTDDM